MQHLCDLQPDGLTGAILALEGIRDAVVVLNGPTGCKAYHSAVSDGQYPRETGHDPLRYFGDFYFGQPRVPSTYLDADDYIFGAAAKLESILEAVAAQDHGLIAMVNSPGAALIGDDLPRLIANAAPSTPCVAVESTRFSGSAHGGFAEAVKAAVARLCPSPLPPIPRTVNLVGASIHQKHWEGSIEELRRLLALCGIRVNAVLCAGVTTEELARVSSAACNAVIYDEYGAALAAWLGAQYGTPSAVPVQGPPVGFDAAECWIKQVASVVSVDPSPALEAIAAARRRSFASLARFNALTGLPKGATFAVQADPSTAFALTRWLYTYLGMIPIAVKTTGNGSDFCEQLRVYLNEIGCSDAWQVDLTQSAAEVVIADGNTIARVRGNGSRAANIEVGLFARGYMDVIPKSILGAEGALYLVEQIINGLNQL
jgi:nitrogenase molybdenum-iron protein alpha/beta subunit